MLPGRVGLEILRAVRRQGSTVPILILSARDTVPDRVNGLELGADDYLIKPFAFEELLPRIRGLLRRGQAHDMLRVSVGDLELDRMTCRVTRAGAAVDLTAREYELLEYLDKAQKWPRVSE